MKKFLWLWILLCAFFAGVVMALTMMLLMIVNGNGTSNEADTGAEASAYEDSEITEVDEPEEPVAVPKTNLPERIDFQPVVDAWAARTGGTRSVLIYDLDRDEVAGEYNADAEYSTASLYKLFVVYEGYRKVQSGEWRADDAAGGTGRTILECLDLAIRASDSMCAETLWDMIGREELDVVVQKDFEMTDTEVSELQSTPRDIVRMMKIFYEHTDVTDGGLIERMKDSFLNQPVTEYNWRQGLPSGFRRANVYNKVGWDYDAEEEYWKLYHDAAIVEFPELSRHFVVVAMTSRVPYQRIRELGQRIEEVVVGE